MKQAEALADYRVTKHNRRRPSYTTRPKCAMNSDEHLCWDLVPKIALIKFLPYECLVFRSEYSDDCFLRHHYIRAAS